MKIIRYNELSPKETFRHRELARDLLGKIKPIFLERYFKNDEKKFFDAELSLMRQLHPLLFAASGDLRNKRILDLACGSRKSPSSTTSNPRMYEPWLCRALNELGYKPVGVDSMKNSDEDFENYVADLYQPKSLNFLRDSSVDIAHAGGLFNLPNFDERLMMSSLIPQLQRIIRPNGSFVYQD